jgi:hypothetical protein
MQRYKKKLKVCSIKERIDDCVAKWLNHLGGRRTARLPKLTFNYTSEDIKDVCRPRETWL